MYRFSVDRLFRFKRDPALMCLLEYYISNNLINRMSINQAMTKHQEAYFEAVEKMFECAHHVHGNKIILKHHSPVTFNVFAPNNLDQ